MFLSFKQLFPSLLKNETVWWYIFPFRKIPCFESDTCYSLAFGVPAALMLIATLILIVGKPFYVFKPPQGNILTQVFGSIWVLNLSNSLCFSHWFRNLYEMNIFRMITAYENVTQLVITKGICFDKEALLEMHIKNFHFHQYWLLKQPFSTIFISACHQTEIQFGSGEANPLVGPRQGEVRHEVGGGHESCASSSHPLSATSRLLGTFWSTGLYRHMSTAVWDWCSYYRSSW